MKRLVGLLLASVFVAAGCSNDSPTGNDQRSDNTVSAPAVATATGDFLDDFEAPINPAVWYREALGQGQWINATENGNGYIYSPPQVFWNTNNRFVDILTVRDDFDDFTVTWDMRFHTRSWNGDHRYLYFRCGNQPNPEGYVVHMGVWIPTIPDNVLQILRLGPDGAKLMHWAYVSYPWTQNEWFSFKLVVSGNSFKLKVWKKAELEPEDWIIEAWDDDAMFSVGRIGFGDYWDSVTDVDNLAVKLPVVPVALDIKPGSCPNPLNAREQPNDSKNRKGAVLPVAILGAADLDVSNIDLASLRLEGLPPIRSEFEDVATPAGGESCACTTTGPDGYMDLTLKFDRASIVGALGTVSNGESVPLTITGRLLDGAAITGVDCVRIIE